MTLSLFIAVFLFYFIYYIRFTLKEAGRVLGSLGLRASDVIFRSVSPLIQTVEYN